MEKVVGLKKDKTLYKVFLIILKYIPHLFAFTYALYTLLGFCGIDQNIIGCFFHISLFSWIYLLLTSIIFKFCYVHRLPLYYIGVNEFITSIDYYIGIPIQEFNLIVVHALLIIFLIFGYSIYYIKKIKQNERQKKILQT